MGSGPHLMICHGLFGAGQNWQRIGKALAERYTVHLVDLLNHGQSPHVTNATYQDQAQAVADTCNYLGIQNMSILGHSMGGKVAIQAAHDYPELVTKLIVADIVPKTYPIRHQEILQAMSSLNLSAVGTISEAETHLARSITDRSTRLFLLTNLIKKGDDYEWRLNINDIRENYNNIAASPTISHPIAQPCLFLRGELSSYVQSDDIELLDRWFSNYNLVTIEGASHWVHADRPKTVIEYCLTHLDRLN